MVMKNKSLVYVVSVLVLFLVLGLSLPASVSKTKGDPIASDAPTKQFVKTRNGCTKSNCRCSGYWGYKHNNGTYEGACSNTDGHGHTCGHGPEKHGLKKW